MNRPEAITAPAKVIRPPGAIARYFVTRGWAHLLLLAGVGIFLFPFVWMVATSLKTDEELTSASWWPQVPTFRDASPYVRPAPPITKPIDVPGERWDALLPRLKELAHTAVNAVPAPPMASGVDLDAWRNAGADNLVNTAIAKLNRKLWDAAEGELLKEYASLLTPDEAKLALDDQLARLELRELQIRTTDAHVFNVCRADEIPKRWTIESGDAAFVPAEGTTVLRYRFDGSSAKPVVLRFDFDFPADPKMLHKLILAMKQDD